MLRKIIYIIVAVACIVALLIGPIDRSPIKEKSFYKDMMTELDTVRLTAYQGHDSLQVGWSRFSITPDHPMPMAGYALRDSFKTVHDTLYTRILAINNGSKQVFMVSMDLLLVPPIIKNSVEERLKELGKDDFVYFGASHTHNGVGGWESHLGGGFIVGTYDEVWVNEVITNTLNNIEKARASMVNTSVSYFDVSAEEYVANRIAWGEGTKDGKIRGLRFERSDKKKAVLFTYSAHATSITSKSRSLSADYPGQVVAELSRLGWDFPMFMAGMVGSHTLVNVPDSNFEFIKNAGEVLAQKIQQATYTTMPNVLPIVTAHVPVKLGPTQLRLFDNWKMRDWVFRSALGPLRAEVTYLKLGDVLFLGASCDFSGELAVNNKFDSLATTVNEHVIISSFNGYYTGYITEDKHYDTYSDREEMRGLNWVGPYHGEYYSEIMKRLLLKK